MKILFITYHFAPYNCIGAVRTTRTAEYLSELGHEVKVVSAIDQDLPETLATSFDKNSIFYTKWIDVNAPVKIFGKSKKDKIKEIAKSGASKFFFVKTIKNILDIYRFIFNIPDRYIGWFFHSKRQSEQVMKNWTPDVIYASATPYTSLLIASSLSKKYNIPWIAELRDLWTDNPYGSIRPFEKYIEKKVLSSASLIVTTTESSANILAKRYNNVSVYAILNGFDVKDFQDNSESSNYGMKSNKKVKILYAGTLYAGKRDPSSLLRLISKNETLKNNIEINFYGDGLSWVEGLVNSIDKTIDVKIFNSLSRDQILKEQKKADILLILSWDNPFEKNIIPGKLFEYIGAMKPILAITPSGGEVSKIVNDNEFGLSSNDEREVENFLMAFLERSYVVNSKINLKYKSNRKLFNRRSQVKKLSDLLTTLVV